jgi:hypothetical protein
MADLLGPLAPFCPISEYTMSLMSRNKSLTLGDVAANLDQPWDRFELSCNTFGWSADAVAKQRQTERTAVLKEELMQRVWHPDRFLTWCDVESGE